MAVDIRAQEYPRYRRADEREQLLPRSCHWGGADFERRPERLCPHEPVRQITTAESNLGPLAGAHRRRRLPDARAD